MSSIFTSPRRASSNNNDSVLNSDQNILKGVIREELGSQTWQFPPDIFIRMLSPKTPLNPENPEENIYIEHFDCDTDKEPFQDACKRATHQFLAHYVGPGSRTWNKDTKVKGKPRMEEKCYYKPMNRFLNKTIGVCRAALNNTRETLFQNIRFFESHDSETMDTAKGSGNLKPDLIMEETDEWPVSKKDKEKREKERFWWSKPDNDSRQITLVCELKSHWSEMISQLATYARCQFDACSSRLFVLTIAFNHKESIARFLIFHRSGLTASHALDLTKQDDKVNFLKIFMTVMIWKEGRDAGFSDSNNNVSYNLGNTIWDISGRLHHTTCVRGRATIVNKVTRRGSNLPDHSPVLSTVESETGNVNLKKRKLEDGDESSVKSSKRRTNGGNSISNILEKIDEDLEVSVTSARRISPNNFCFLIKARGPPEHYLKAHQENLDDPTRHTEAVKDCWPIVGREDIEGESLGSSFNEFGVANIRATYKACYKTGQLQSTSIFLPKDEDAGKYHYPIFEAFSGKLPEPRMRILIEITSIGKSFLKVEPGEDLAICVAHSMLGWLNVYQNGFLHRDISIGNVLAFVNAEERKPFKLTDAFKKSLEGVTMQMLNDKLAKLELKEVKKILIPDAPSWATKLEQLLEEHNLDTTCSAFIIDGDMAKNWKGLFAGWGKEKGVSSRERSGTELFMSQNVLSRRLQNYIQSPTDDIESFVWVTLYAILNNKEPRSSKEQDAAEYFEIGKRGDALNLYISGGLTEVMNDLVGEWNSAAIKLGGAYASLLQVFSQISEKNGWQDEKEEARYWEVAWHGYALQGVCQSLEFILKYINQPGI